MKFPRVAAGDRCAEGVGNVGVEGGRAGGGGAVRGVRSYAPFEGGENFAALQRQGAAEGSIAKFKLLSYAMRTFCFRNLGTPLAKGATDFAQFRAAVAQVAKSAR